MQYKDDVVWMLLFLMIGFLACLAILAGYFVPYLAGILAIFLFIDLEKLEGKNYLNLFILIGGMLFILLMTGGGDK